MWPMIASLEPLVQALAPAFSEPSFRTHCQLLLGWVLCLGNHRLCRVADTAAPQELRDHSRRHGLDTTYNFFERSAWTPKAHPFQGRHLSTSGIPSYTDSIGLGERSPGWS